MNKEALVKWAKLAIDNFDKQGMEVRAFIRPKSEEAATIEAFTEEGKPLDPKVFELRKTKKGTKAYLLGIQVIYSDKLGKWKLFMVSAKPEPKPEPKEEKT